MDTDESDISESNDAEKLRTCTGLLKSYHGIAYQVQWLMLVALEAKDRGVVSGFTFNTEVEYEDSGKFDDVVWQYTEENILKYNFLQAKHKRNLNETIKIKDLLKKGMDTKNNPFGLQKYYISYMDGIKNNTKYKNGIIENLIIATNIDLEGQLKSTFTPLEIMHPLLDIDDDDGDGPCPACWKIDSTRNVEIIEVLEETYDLINLAKKLDEYIFNQKNVCLPAGLLKYSNSLHRHVFNDEGNKISNDFIENKNLSREAMFLREAFFREAFVKKKKSLPEEQEIAAHIQNPDMFAEYIAEKIKNASDKVVKLIKYKGVELNINKLANFVLIKEDGIKFNSRFWTNHDLELPNNTFGTFRNKLKARLQAFGILEINDTNSAIVAKLNEYRFKIANFTACRVHLIDESSFWDTVKRYNISENMLFMPNNHHPQELPSYSLNDIKSDIKIFLDNLVFAVNYTKTKLNSVVENNFKQNFKWIDNEHTAYAFRSEIAHALDVTEDHFISTAEEVSRFFDKLKQKTNQLILVGPTLEYSTKISFYNIRFKSELINELPINSFINNILEDCSTMPNTASSRKSNDSGDISSKQVYCMISEQNILSSIKVLHVLQNTPKYSNQNNYIFMRLDSMLYLQDYVIQVFQESVNLLIIECDVEHKERLVRKIYRKILSVLRSDRDKKVLLISQGNDLLSSTLKRELEHSYFEKNDSEIGFSSLEEATQLNILQRGKIEFQGEEISINKLVTELKHLIDSQMLYKLINHEKLEICNSLSDLKEIKEYYVPRELICRKKVSLKILEDDSAKDLLAFSNTEVDELRDLARQYNVTQNIRIRNFNDSKNNDINSIVRFIILDNQLGASQYSSLCNVFGNSNVHWLIKEGNYFKWKQTNGVLTNVRPHLKVRKYYKENNDDNANEIITELKNERVIIIAAEPGMGKSTMIINLAMRMKKIDPTSWVTVIDLKKHRSQLKKIDLSDNDSAMQFLYKVIGFKALQEIQEDAIVKQLCTGSIEKNLKGINLLEVAIFQNMLTKNNEVFIFFDGYDEISPEFEEHVTFLINVIKNTTLANIWITSRTYNIIHDLEDDLGTFSYSIKPFGILEQRRFFVQFWRSCLNVVEFDEQRSSIFIQELLSEFSNITNDTKRTFVGIPLQIRMLAQNRFEMFKEFYESGVLQINSEYRSRIKKGLNLVNLYEDFINIKFHEIRFKEKKPVWPSDDEDIEKMVAEERKVFIYEHQILAVYALYNNGFENIFPEKIKEISVSLLPKIERGADKNAIIERVIDDTPLFVHQTYAEFFAALFLWNKYKTLTLHDFHKCFLPNILNGIFFPNDKIQVCKFFYYIADKCLRQDTGNDFVQMKEKITSTLKEIVSGVENIYVSYERAGTDLENGVDSLKQLGRLKLQNIFGVKTYVQVTKSMLFMIESYLSRDQSENLDIVTVINNDKSLSLLRMASEIGCSNFVQMYIDRTHHNYKERVGRSKWYFSPLWLAAKNGHLEALGFLSGIMDRNWSDKDSLTLTQCAYNLPEFNVVRNCLKSNILDANLYIDPNYEQVLPIVRAVENAWPTDIIELLLEKTDVNTFNNFTYQHRNLKGSSITCFYLLKQEQYITDLFLQKGFDFFGAINVLLFEFSSSSLMGPINALRYGKSVQSDEWCSLFDLILKILKTGVGYNTTDKREKTTSQYAQEIYYMHKLFQNMSNNTSDNKVLDTLLWLIVNATANYNRDFKFLKYNDNLHVLTNRYRGLRSQYKTDMRLISVFDKDIFSFLKNPIEVIQTNINNLKSYIEEGNEEIFQFKRYDDSKLYNNIFIGYEEMLEYYPFSNKMSKVNLFQSLSNFEKIMLKRILILYIRQDYEIKEAFDEVTRNILKYKRIHAWMQTKPESCNITRDEIIDIFDLHDIEISQSESKMQLVEITKNIFQCGSLESLHEVWLDLNYVGETRLLDIVKTMSLHVQISSQIYELFRTLDGCQSNLIDTIKNNSQGLHDALNSIDNCLIKSVINGRDAKNSPLLHYAVKDKDAEALLLEHGANLDDDIGEDDFIDYDSSGDSDDL